jgi:hypothetical protein
MIGQYQASQQLLAWFGAGRGGGVKGQGGCLAVKEEGKLAEATGEGKVCSTQDLDQQ